MTSKVSNIFLLALTVVPILFIVSGIYIRQVLPDYTPFISSNLTHRLKSTGTSEKNSSTPVRLEIPSIGVSAQIESTALTPDGEMGVPQNPLNVGWYQIGKTSIADGTAVISGHLNQINGKNGVFANLHQLKPGDDIFIDDDSGGSTTFVVRETRVYDPGYADEVFGSQYGTHLNLVTCDGVWDRNKKTYDKRLVVFTDLK